MIPKDEEWVANIYTKMLYYGTQQLLLPKNWEKGRPEDDILALVTGFNKECMELCDEIGYVETHDERASLDRVLQEAGDCANFLAFIIDYVQRCKQSEAENKMFDTAVTVGKRAVAGWGLSSTDTGSGGSTVPPLRPGSEQTVAVPSS